MTADRHELYELVEELPDDQVASAIADLRRRLPQARSAGTWPPEFFGIIDGDSIPSNVARNVDDFLAASGFGREPLVAAAVTTQPDHHACIELFTGLRLANRPLLVLPTVVAETAFMLEKLGGARAEAAFVRALANGDLAAVDLEVGDYGRIAELIEQYADLPLGATDASVVAVAERLGVSEVATLDRRHFSVVRPSHVEALTLLPE